MTEEVFFRPVTTISSISALTEIPENAIPVAHTNADDAQKRLSFMILPLSCYIIIVCYTKV